MYSTMIAAAEDGEWGTFALLAHLHPPVLSAEYAAMIERVPDQVRLRHPHLIWYRIHLAAQDGVPRAQMLEMGRPLLEHDAGASAAAASPIRALRDGVARVQVLRLCGEHETAAAELDGLLPRLEAVCSMTPEAVEGLPHRERIIQRAFVAWMADVMRLLGSVGKLLLGLYTEALAMVEPLVIRPGAARGGELPPYSIAAAGTKALILACLGDHRRADEALDELASHRLPEGWRQSRFAASAAMAAAYISLAEGAPELAQEQLERVRIEDPTLDSWPIALDQWARLRLYYGRGPTREEFLRLLRLRAEMPPTTPYWQLHLTVRAAGLALEEGDLESAQRHLDEARGLDYPARPGLTLERAEASLLLTSGEFGQAAELAGRLLASGRPTPREEFVLRFVLAVAEHRLGRTEEAGDQLCRTLRLGDQMHLSWSLAHFHSRDVLAEMLQAYAPERTRLLAELRAAVRQ